MLRMSKSVDKNLQIANFSLGEAMHCAARVARGAGYSNI